MSAAVREPQLVSRLDAAAVPSLPADAVWKSLYRVAGVAALISVALIPVAIVILIASPPPGTVAGWFTLLQSSPLVGLFDLDLVMVIDNLLLIPIFLALYLALRRVSESVMALAVTLGLVGMAVYLSSNPAFTMLSLSHQYGAATTEAERSVLLAAGQSILAIWQGTAFDVSYVLAGIALLAISLVMLRGSPFGRPTALIGALTGALMLVPPTVESIGLVFAFLSLVPLAVWYVLIGVRFLRLGRGFA